MTEKAPLVLIAEDDDDNRAMYVEYLDHFGYRTAEAKTGAEAIRMTRQSSPAAIVMDLSLPEVDGLDATEMLKTDPQTRGTYVIVLTGHADEAHRSRASAAGVDAYLLKPCAPQALLDQLKIACVT